MDRYRVNRPRIVDETIDGESLIMDMVTGSYYGCDGPSAFAWMPRLRGVRTAVTVHGLDWQREKWGRLASWVLKQCEYPAAHFPNKTIVVSKTSGS